VTVLDQTGAEVAKAGASAGESTPSQPTRFNPDGSGGPGPKYLRTEVLLGVEGNGFADRMMVRFAERLLGIDRVNAICRKAGPPWPSSSEMIDHLFRELGIKWEVVNPQVFDALGDRPAIFVANHPYGMADAFAVNNMLETHRPNFRLFANQFLTMADSITHKLLFVDPLMSEEYRVMNRRSVMMAIRHLKANGDLALFPGRLCSHLVPGKGPVQDTAWSDQIKTFVETSGADLVPMHISGENSRWFQYAGLVHPKLRTYRILREFLRGNREFTVTLGNPVPAEEFLRASTVTPAGDFARSLTYLLKRPDDDFPERAAKKSVAVPGAASGLSKERRIAAALDVSELLAEQKDFQIYKTGTQPALTIMDELSQIRYDAFKNELPADGPAGFVDRYDDYNSHLLLWNSKDKRLAGSYRYLMPGDDEAAFSVDQLVTSTIFKLGPEFQRLLPQSIELGRVAISPDYQKSYFPMMMLWRGVLSLVARNPDMRLIFGPIAFSPNFTTLSLEALRLWLTKHALDENWAPHVSALVEPDMRIPPEIDVEALISDCDTITKLNTVVTAIERGGRPLPVLLRHYSSAGTRFAGFGTWQTFDNALTTLVAMDVNDFRPGFLKRYLGKEETRRFLAHRKKVSA
jgi:putative hemolysin